MQTGQIKEFNKILNTITIFCTAILIITGILQMFEINIVPTNISSITRFASRPIIYNY